MKLKNLNEAFELDDEISIVDRLKFAGYTKKIKMNNDGSFDLLADMMCDTHQVPPLGINKAKKVSFHNTRFLSPKHAQNMLPKLCKSLTFRYCEFYSLDEFIIKTKISEILKFDGNNMKSCKKIEIHDVKNIEFDGRYNGTNIEIFDVSKIKIGKASVGNKYCLGLKHSKETKKKLSELRIDNINTKLVLDLQMGIFYVSLTRACEALNIDYKLTSNRLRGRTKNDTNLIYI